MYYIEEQLKTKRKYWHNISSARHGVSLAYPNTKKKVENTTRSGVFGRISSVWITDETLSRVFDISSRSKQKLISSKRRNEIVKPGIQIYFTVTIFFILSWWIIQQWVSELRVGNWNVKVRFSWHMSTFSFVTFHFRGIFVIKESWEKETKIYREYSCK